MNGQGRTVDQRTDLREMAGVRTYIREEGSGDPPLVMLHGVLSDGASWQGVSGRLAMHRRVVTPDLPLHGSSHTPPDFKPGPEGMVVWLEALLDALGTEQADLAGLSMGGAVAVHFALLRPRRLRRLVLVDAANIVGLDEGYRQFITEMRENLEAALGVDIRTSRQCWTEELGFEGAKTAAVGLCTDPIVMSVLEYLEARGIPFGQVVHGLDLLEPVETGELRGITAPTMALWGADDPFFPAGAAEAKLREGIPDCRVEVMEGVGHNPVAERPGEAVRLIEEFLG
jgi:pimeloyl-ACP methyl ester carboxylesterase